VNRGKGFYESREVNDLSHLLRVIANPRDEFSLATVLRSPLAGVSDEALLQLRIMGDNIGASLMRMGPQDASGFNPADYSTLSRFGIASKLGAFAAIALPSTACCWRPSTIALSAGSEHRPVPGAGTRSRGPDDAQ